MTNLPANSKTVILINLNYFGLMDKIQVGIPGGMNDIIEAQWKAEKVITV